MAVPKAALVGLVAVAGVAAAATMSKPKSKSGSKRPPRRVGGFKAPPVPAMNHPICKKYPGGNWGQGTVKGYPEDNPGWSEDDARMVKQAVNDALATAPPFVSMSQGRKEAFRMTREIVRGFCPAMELPTQRSTVESYLSKSLGLRWLWEAVARNVWDAYSGVST